MFHSVNSMQRSLVLGLLLVSLLIVAAPSLAQEGGTPIAPRLPPLPDSTITQENVTLELFFTTVPQGRAALLRVSGANIAGARLRFREETSEFFPVDGDGYYGLLAVNMDLTPRVYDFSVLIWRDDGSRVTIPAQVQVVDGGFILQNITVSTDRAYLVDAEIERLEFARLDSIFAQYTAEKLWADGGFQLPIDSELTSPFGAFRVINSAVETRHTGWDLTAPVGMPVMAMAAGRVAFAGTMDIRGNYVVIDHGYGIFSAYAHLSQVHVTRGQTVTRGQIIGVSGDTGRSGGPHFHWEVIVNGEFVDAADFLALWLP